MQLNQALTRLKNLKSKVSRVEAAINDSAVHYEDQAPDYSYGEELVKRAQLVDEIRKLKTQIQLTNASTFVEYGGNQVTLAELILINADLRSEMAFVTKQTAHSTESEARWGSARSKDDIKKVYADGYNKALFRKRLEELEREKEKIEALLADANASATLVTQ